MQLELPFEKGEEMTWLKIIPSSAASEQLLEASRVMSLKKSGTTVTFITDSGAQYQWAWDGKIATWAKLMVALNLSEQV